MPDCGFVSLTRRLAVTVGYNSREIPLPVKGSLLTVREPPLSLSLPPSLSLSLSLSLSFSLSLFSKAPLSSAILHFATLPVTLRVMRISLSNAFSILQPHSSRVGDSSVETSSMSKVLCTPKLAARGLAGRDRAHRDSVTKIPFKATEGRGRGPTRRWSIIVDNRIA